MENTTNLVELLHFPTYTKQEKIAAHQEWLQLYKDTMTFDAYLALCFPSSSS